MEYQTEHQTEVLPISLSKSRIVDDVLFQLPLKKTGGAPDPCSNSDGNQFKAAVHVMLADSPNFIHPHKKRRIWDIVCETFRNIPKDFAEFEEAICSYNENVATGGKLKGFKNVLEYEFSAEEKDRFFQGLLPKIIALALSLPKEILKPLPMLTEETTEAVSLSQKQIGVLLANAFLCTFPTRKIKGRKCGEGRMPDINFDRFFFIYGSNTAAKWRCIINYFDRITAKEPDGVVTFVRQYKDVNTTTFRSSEKPLPDLKLELEGLIEDAPGHIYVDFADKYIGGMILTGGCVQEEILFLKFPEMIITRLFTPVIGAAEALIVTGLERFNDGKGYGHSFEFERNYQDDSPRDRYRRRRNSIIAIDATNFRRRASEQYKPEFMLKEIQKAYAGFCPVVQSNLALEPIATGNWGCGIFAGNVRLKSLLQLIAAGEAGRDVKYFAFGFREFVNELDELYKLLQRKGVTVGRLTSILLSYSKGKSKPDGKDLYAFIKQEICREI